MTDNGRCARHSVWLAILTVVLAYIGTVGIGAAMFPFQFGQAQLADALYPAKINFDVSSLGSPAYWLVFLSILTITPVAALLTGNAVSKLSPRTSFPEIQIVVPVVLGMTMSAFCIYKLASVGALSALEAFSTDICYTDKILRRTELIGQLGNLFYAIVYSALPMVSCYLLAAGIKDKDRVALIASGVFSAVILWFDIAIFFKGAALVYMLMLGATAWLSGFGLVRSTIVTVAFASILYLALSFTQFCNRDTASWDRAPIATSASIASAPSANVSNAEPSATAKAAYMARAVLFRMAAGFPYYIDMFSDPSVRCGIVIPPRDFLPSQKCFAPIVVFKRMYPEITYATGYQPAPVNASAYAEAGPWYVVFATAICGIILGGLAAMARDRSPLSIAILVATCTYAYFATQSSLTGSIIDGYGLLWLLLPIILMIISGHLQQGAKWSLIVRKL